MPAAFYNSIFNIAKLNLNNLLKNIIQYVRKYFVNLNRKPNIPTMKNITNSDKVENNTTVPTSNDNKPKSKTNRVLKIILIVCCAFILLQFLAYGVGYLVGTIEGKIEANKTEVQDSNYITLLKQNKVCISYMPLL